MRSESERRTVQHLAVAGLNASEIAYVAGIPRSTVREWLVPPRPRAAPHAIAIDLGAIPEPQYSYLLGFYLGDGTISRHRRCVYRLRIITDALPHDH